MADTRVQLKSNYRSTALKDAALDLDITVQSKDSKGVGRLDRLRQPVAECAQEQIARFEDVLKEFDTAHAAYLVDVDKLTKAGKTAEAATKTKGMKELIGHTEKVLKSFKESTERELKKAVTDIAVKLTKEDKALRNAKILTVVKVTVKIGAAATVTAAGAGVALGTVAITGATYGGGAPTIIVGVGALLGGISSGVKLVLSSIKEISEAMRSERGVRADIAKSLVQVSGQINDAKRAAGQDKGKMDKLKALFRTNHAKKCKDLLAKHDLKLTALRKKSEALAKKIDSILKAQDKVAALVLKKENQNKLDPKKKIAFEKKNEALGEKMKSLLKKIDEANLDYELFAKWNLETKAEVESAEATLPPPGFGQKALAGAAQVWKVAEPLMDLGSDAAGIIASGMA